MAMIGRRAGQPGPGDRGVAHAAAADHRDRVAARDVAGVHRRAESGHHTAAEQADDRGIGVRVDLGALALVHEGFVGECADAERGGQLRAVGQRHRLAGVEGVEAVPRPAAPARPAAAADRPPVQHDEVADLDVGDRAPARLDDASGLMTEQEREFVVDPAVPVGQIGVAHPARLDAHDHVVRAWDRG